MPETVRHVARKFRGSPTLEGAGVRLRRMFGNSEVPLLDPFLLLDNFGSTNPEDYLAGFPWHPHRGIETVTYMLNGSTDHEDSLGNAGTIGAGDVQWMSAGSGILHQEMPKRTEGLLSGFQLWVNLPHARKMEVPAYRGVDAVSIPTLRGEDGRSVKVIAGTHEKVEGPVRHIPVDPLYLDVELPPDAEFHRPIPAGHTAFAQVMEGSGSFDPSGLPSLGPAPPPVYEGEVDPSLEARTTPGHTLLYGDGEAVRIRAGSEGVRFLLVSGRPLHEPVAWYGPIVMNTREEILEAVSDLKKGSFIRSKRVVNER
ncbi:MAG TPA: pirin family protein [Thermoplasmata archaeon]|nr:pirin family protein [Thermoplasmata archaeon]